jgi:hypothetical protein
MAGVEQLLRRGSVEIEPLRLVERAFVPVEAEPTHPIKNAFDHSLGGALEVGVFDAQDEGATGVASKEPVEERGAGTPHVQVAGRGGCETDAGTFRRNGHRRVCLDARTFCSGWVAVTWRVAI